MFNLFSQFRRRRSRRDPDLPLVFNHLPKCAGTSLVDALQTALKPNRAQSGLLDGSLFGDFSAFSKIPAAQRAKITLEGDRFPADLDFVTGHLARHTTIGHYPKANHMVILREPRARLLSHWLFWRQQSDFVAEGWGPDWSRWVAKARQPLHAFLMDPEIACQTDNMMLRMLLWPDRRIPASGFIGSEHDAALARGGIRILRQFDFFDYSEDPALAANIEAWLGCGLALQRLNEARKPSPGLAVSLKAELTPEVEALVRTRSRLDTRIWTEIVNLRGAGANTEAIAERAYRTTIDRHEAMQSAVRNRS